MTQLGERLRIAREDQGLSLAEAAAATRILPRYLQALEMGDLQSLPGDVYARGFIRNYAQLLHLPAEELILLYRQERGEPTGKIKVMPAAVPPRNRSCLIPSLSFFGAFFMIVVLVALAYFGAESFGLFRKQTTTALNATATRTIPPPTPFPTATLPAADVTPSRLPPTEIPTSLAGTPGPTLAPGQTAIATTPITPGQLVVGVSVIPQSGGSWMEVRVDNVPTFNRLLQAGQSQQWSPQREIYLNIGDTSAIILTINGQSCPGFPGAVRGVARRLTIVNGVCPQL